ncbi:MAG: hypothetical protein AAFN65_08500, partial [Bacteroidota bacterium]
NMQMELVAPLDGDFKVRPSTNLRLLNINQTLWSRSDKLEIRAPFAYYRAWRGKLPQVQVFVLEGWWKVGGGW